MQQQSLKLNKFGEKLGYLLSVKGWSQQQLADKLCASQPCVSRWINGDREPCFDDMILLCYFLDADPNEMLGFDELRENDFAEIIKARAK